MLKSQLIGIILMLLITAAYATINKSVTTTITKIEKKYTWADSVNIQDYENYIKEHTQYAISQESKYRIPASITLAQGLLESSSGQSKLAVLANNHFGIKCFSKSCQKGHCINYSDDSHKDFFRVYKNSYESFEHHSKFLHKNRYKHLLMLDVSDYKSWSHGLKKAGYATDSQYAYKLISIIEKFKLHEIK
ncbi:MAG: glycoside hydrolase family 73 protein [Saprospiraceae bacterium]